MKNGFLDFHSHILPDMDDGAALPAESIEMLKAEKRAGVSDVCLTPHYYQDDESIPDFLIRRQRSYSRLRQQLSSSFGSFPELHLGAEIYYYEGISKDPNLDMLCCGASRCLLIEPPMKKWSQSMLQELADIRKTRRFQPVVAHVDRYISYLDNPALCSKVRQYGLWVQFNASAFLSGYTSEMSLTMLQRGEIYFIGSDAHNSSNRSVNMKELVSVLRKKELEDCYRSLSKSGLALIRGKK